MYGKQAFEDVSGAAQREAKAKQSTKCRLHWLVITKLNIYIKEIAYCILHG